MHVTRSEPQTMVSLSSTESKFRKDLPLLTELLLKLKSNYESLSNNSDVFYSFNVSKETPFSNIKRIQSQIKAFCSETISNTLTLEADEEQMLREIITVLNHPTEKQLSEYKQHNWKIEHEKLEGVVNKLLTTNWKAWQSPKSCLTLQPVLSVEGKKSLNELRQFIFAHLKSLEESKKRHEGTSSYTRSGSISLTDNISKLREMLHRVGNSEEVPVQKVYELVQILEQHRIFLNHFVQYALNDSFEKNIINGYLDKISKSVQEISKKLNFPEHSLEVLIHAYLEDPYPYADKFCLEPEILKIESLEGNSWVEPSKKAALEGLVEQFISLKQFVGTDPNIEIPNIGGGPLFVFQGKDDFYITGPNQFLISLNNDNKTLEYSPRVKFQATKVKEFIEEIHQYLENKSTETVEKISRGYYKLV